MSTPSRFALLATSVLLAGSGCCTRAGCEDVVAWDLPASFPGLATTDLLSVRACLDSACVDAPLIADPSGQRWISADAAVMLFVPSQLSLRLGSTEVARSGLATVEVTRNGQVIVTDSRQVTLTSSFQPNGPLCPPVCYSTRVPL